MSRDAAPKILIVKMTSMGDLIHALPAIDDLCRHLPNATIDWVAEKNFSLIAQMHPRIRRVIPIELRGWRKAPLKAFTQKSIQSFWKQLREERYDYVVDMQGLQKSGLVARLAKGPTHGLDRNSAREPHAAMHYRYRYPVTKGLHAILRNRQLLAQIFDYTIDENDIRYGITPEDYIAANADNQLTQSPNPYVVFLHGTTWTTKHYPESYWHALAKHVCDTGIEVHLAWGNDAEKARAERIQSAHPNVRVLGKMNLHQLAVHLAGARASVCVDTGLGHLCAALNVPTIALFGPTDPIKTGILGPRQRTLQTQFKCAPCMQDQCQLEGDHTVNPPCFGDLNPDRVFGRLCDMIGLQSNSATDDGVTTTGTT